MFSRVQLFETPWTAAHQASLSFAISQSLFKCPLSWWCHPTISSSATPFSPALNLSQHQDLFQWVCSSQQVAKILELQLQHQPFQCIFRVNFLWIDWSDLLSVQGTLQSLLQHHNSKASIISCSAFFMFQFSYPHMSTGKPIAWIIWSVDGKVMSLLFNMWSRFAITFLPMEQACFLSSDCLSTWWLKLLPHWFGAPQNKICHGFHSFPIYLPLSDGTRCHDLCFLNVGFWASFFKLCPFPHQKAL